MYSARTKLETNNHRAKITSVMEPMRQQCYWPRRQKQPTFSSIPPMTTTCTPLIAHKRLVAHRSIRGTTECSTVDLIQARPSTRAGPL
ncbi:uncharacterized protein N7529_010025 [Penicillium soppii]|uniref:uncharacterized protein n=1 Tax=Penicillium soppii TaxID=69789 RepID=UPI002547ABAD|nr:uncharacterized protein N7529_010025 [Penicillium soppii]KAJ5856081.1 hypothetical protein N7529_010025 [Penicillium soppii]